MTSKASDKTTSSTDSRFTALSFKNGILDLVYFIPPANLEELQKRVNRPRSSVSPTKSEYRSFVHRTQKAPNEMTIMMVTSELLRSNDTEGYSRVYFQSFNNFPKNVGFNNGLAAPQPDMIEGLDLTEFAPSPFVKNSRPLYLPQS